MFSTEFLQSDLFNWVILPALIFISRLCDVTLGTLRHVFISKGMKNVVPVVGFMEVLIWLVAISQIMKNLNNIACYLAFAGGFAAGTYCGMWVEEKLALGMQVIRLITNLDYTSLVEDLKSSNIGVTMMDAMGSKGPVKIIFIVIARKDVEGVIKMINKHNPRAFYSIEDIRTANQGVFAGKQKRNYLRNLFSGK